MCDPLQNILDCCDCIVKAREHFKSEDPLTRQAAAVGEADHLAEYRRQVEEIFGKPEGDCR